MRQPDHWLLGSPALRWNPGAVEDRACNRGGLLCDRGAFGARRPRRPPLTGSRCNTTATSGRSWPRTASRATGPIAPPAKPTFASTSARRPSKPAPSRRATSRPAS